MDTEDATELQKRDCKRALRWLGVETSAAWPEEPGPKACQIFLCDPNPGAEQIMAAHSFTKSHPLDPQQHHPVKQTVGVGNVAGHRFAKPAARAAECAEQQGRFAAFVDAVFDKQDSIGLKSWVSYGRAAQVPDSIRYIRCLDSPAMFPRIDSGLTMAERAGVSATPTVFVNGWRFPRPPSSQELSRVITDLLAGSEPFSDQR